MKIKSIVANETLDSKGEPTLEVEVILEDKTIAKASVPSGASTGKSEVLELRDGDPTKYGGRGVSKAITHVNETLAGVLIDKDAYQQKAIDQLMIKVDGTNNKSNLGANAIVGVSLAVCRAAALSQKMPLYRWIGQLASNYEFSLPQPQVLLLEGGQHGNWATDIQEYFIIPKVGQFRSFRHLFTASEQIFLALGQVLKDRGYTTHLGFEGAYSPSEIQSNNEGFSLLMEAIKRAGYKPGEQFDLGVDVAASEFFQDGVYVLHSEANRQYRPEVWMNQLVGWLESYPLWSIEDGFDQEAWQDWQQLMTKVGSKVQIVGDDLLTTNVERIKKAIQMKAANAAIIKVNQIGTVTEALEAIRTAKQAGMSTIVSHRGGETSDDFIADLAVGAGCPQCKFGGPTRKERRTKYNRLLEIEKELAKNNG